MGIFVTLSSRSALFSQYMVFVNPDELVFCIHTSCGWCVSYMAGEERVGGSHKIPEERVFPVQAGEERGATQSCHGDKVYPEHRD